VPVQTETEGYVEYQIYRIRSPNTARHLRVGASSTVDIGVVRETGTAAEATMDDHHNQNAHWPGPEHRFTPIVCTASGETPARLRDTCVDDSCNPAMLLYARLDRRLFICQRPNDGELKTPSLLTRRFAPGQKAMWQNFFLARPDQLAAGARPHARLAANIARLCSRPGLVVQAEVKASYDWRVNSSIRSRGLKEAPDAKCG